MTSSNKILIGSIFIIVFGSVLVVRGLDGFNGDYHSGFGSLEIFTLVPIYATGLIFGVVLLGRGIDSKRSRK